MPGITATSNSPILADRSSMARTRSWKAAGPPLPRSAVPNACSVRAPASIPSSSALTSLPAPDACAHALMSSSVGRSFSFSIFHTRDWTTPIRCASALPDSPAAARRSRSRAARLARLSVPGSGGGTVKACSLLRDAALEMGTGSDVIVPGGGAVHDCVTRLAGFHDALWVMDAAGAAPLAVRRVVHHVELAGVEQPEVEQGQVVRPYVRCVDGDDADVLARGHVADVAVGQLLLPGRPEE